MFTLIGLIRISIHIFDVYQSFHEGISDPISVLYGGLLAAIFIFYPIEVIRPLYLRLS